MDRPQLCDVAGVCTRGMMVEQPQSNTTTDHWCPMRSVPLLRTFHWSGHLCTVSLLLASNPSVGHRTRHRGHGPKKYPQWIGRETGALYSDVGRGASVCAAQSRRDNGLCGACQCDGCARAANSLHRTGHRLAVATVVRAKRYPHSWLYSPESVTLVLEATADT